METDSNQACLENLVDRLERQLAFSRGLGRCARLGDTVEETDPNESLAHELYARAMS